jgi:Icc-related predicted phosphoesterase
MLVASDVHYRLRSLDWLCARADEYDALVVAGDLLDVTSAVPIEAQIVVLTSYLRRLASLTRLFVTSGNHDLDGPGEHGEQVCSWLPALRSGNLHTDGETVDVDGIRFTLCPWWDGPVTRSLVDAQLLAAAKDRPALEVWVYHSPPAGTALCFDGHRAFPDEDLASWIEQYQPDLVICGHIHQAPWAPGGSWYDRLGRTWAFNAGHLLAPVPPHIVIDTTQATALWYGDVTSGVARLDLRDGSTFDQPSGSRAEPGRASGA